MSEDSLKRKIQLSLERDFVLLNEVSGHHSIYGKNVRIDFLVKAKDHLIEEGFTDQWFGVECKWSAGVIGQTSKVTRMFWQSITYAQSQFLVNNEPITPKFVAIYVPDELQPNIAKHLRTLSQLALYGNVGELYF